MDKEITITWLDNVETEIAAMHALTQVMQHLICMDEHVEAVSIPRIADWFDDKYGGMRGE